MTDQHNEDGLFSNNDASDGNQPDPVSQTHTSESDNPLESLVGEGKKFKSVEDLARGKMESDKFIAQMQREQQELREELNKRLTVEEVLAKIEERQKRSSAPVDDEDYTKSNSSEDRGVDMSAIEKLVESKFNEAQSMADQRRNMQSVKNIMRERFGADYIRVMESKLEELGVGKDWANGLAATQPKAFLGLMGAPTKPSGDVTAPPQSQMRSTPSTGHKTMADFDKLRREDPARYFSKDVQMEMHRLALANPDEFLS